MTTKKIKTSDILGDNYYIYELTSSNYTPNLNGTITITCTMKDVYGAAAGSKSITLYQNGTSKGTQTTNSSGVATWSITCSTAGLQKFSIKDTSIEVFVDNKEDTSNKLTSLQSLNDLSTDTQYPSAKLVYTYWSDLNDTLQNDYPLSNSLGAVAFSNAYEDLDGLPSLGNLAFENDVDLSGHDLDELSDNTNLLFSGDYNDLDNKPTIPTATSDLINDSGFLTSHQSLDSKTVTVEKLATAESGYLSSYVVKQNGTQVGNTINIPKDFLVKSGSVKTVSTANNPVSGYSVGDKYIDLVINVQEGTSTDSHIYILVSDLIDTPVAITDVTGLQSALNGKIDTAGTGLSKSGTTLNHSNSLTALGSASFKKIKYDANGHITGTTDVTASDLPSHTHSPSQVSSGISSNDWLLTYMQGDGSTQEYFNQSVNHEIDNIWNEFSGVYNTFNDFELVALKTDDISQLTSNTEYYPSAKGVADYVDYIIPVTNLSDFNDDLNYAPTAHATSATTYGVSSASNYGHAMASSTSPKANGTAAVGSETAKFARGDHVHPHSCVNNLTNTSTTTPLAANQGKVLNDTKADKSTVVDWDNIVFVDKTDDDTGSIILNFLS